MKLKCLIATKVAGCIFSVAVHAGIPVWTYSDPVPALATVASNGTTTVQYTVTNNSIKPKNLSLKGIPGVSASSCNLATRGSTCTLTLTINGSAVPAEGIHTGPLLCTQGDLNQCYQPEQQKMLNVVLNNTPPIVTPTNMVAVGFYNGSQYIPYSYYSIDNGENWIVSPMLPAPQSQYINQLTGVSCNGIGSCSAVGFYFDGALNLPVSYYSSDFGASWSTSTSPTPQGSGDNYLYSISCNMSGSCATVGKYFDGSMDVPLSYYSTDFGATWTLSSTLPQVQGTIESVLTGISCNTTGLCAAVGYYLDNSFIKLPVSYYSSDFGKNWTASLVPPQAQGSSDNSLTSVTCYGNNFCTAVSSYDDGSRNVPMAYYSNDSGINWLNATTPPPAQGLSNNSLTGVSCLANGSCATVGTYTLSGTNTSLSYYSNDFGQSWSLSTTLPPAPGGEAELSGVFCSSNGSCSAVGGNRNDGALIYFSNDLGKNWVLAIFPSLLDGYLNSAG